MSLSESGWQSVAARQRTEIARLMQALEAVTAESIRRRRALGELVDALRAAGVEAAVDPAALKAAQEEVMWTGRRAAA